MWPYYYAGTMGLVMRDGINRLRHVKNYSGQYSTICTTLAWTGYIAGTGKLAGPDPREMALSDCVVIWGTNPVHTQVNVMTHAMRARKERGAKIVAIDIYMNATMKQADMALLVRPGTDGALACAVMHVLFRDGYADWDYLDRYTDCPRELEAHLRDPRPGLGVRDHRAFGRGDRGVRAARRRAQAHLLPPRLRLRPPAQRRRQHARGVLHRGGDGRLAATRAAAPSTTTAPSTTGDKTLIEGLDAVDPAIRSLDQSQIGRVLTGDPEALRHGPPVTAMLIQNTNPVSVAPEQELVKRGFAREDLFVCVHEQFMTETALMADIVLPATMFMEHDDLYQGGGHQYIQLGPKLVEPPGECRSQPRGDLRARRPRRRRASAASPWSPREIIDWTLQRFRLGHARGAGAAGPHRRAAAVPGGALTSTASPIRTASSASSRTGRRCRTRNDGPMGPWAEHAGAAGPLGRDRGGDRGASVPARDEPGAALPQLHLHRDADLARQGAPAGGDDPSRRRGARRGSPTATG